jgi:DNA-binding CsgD family transcriptional regulator/tetratricopeptide (TPR) repeat protein
MPNTRTAKKPVSRLRRKNGGARPLVGRADTLEDLLESAALPASAILVVGMPGSGRSTLLDGVRASASVRTALVTPHPRERFRPFAGLSLVLNSIGDQRLSEFIGNFRFDDPSVEETLAGALELLLRLRSGKREEILLLIDDADQFDEQSQLALTYLAGRLVNTGLRLVMAVTPESTTAAFAGIRSVWISRLDRAQSMELARSIAPTADEQTLAMVCDGCSDLPGMIVSALGHLTTDQLDGHAPLALPLYPGPAPLEFGSWEPETVLLLRRLSTAPMCSLSALSGIRDVDRDRFERLTSQGVLEINGPYVAIRDGALRSSLYWSMTTSQREELHRLAASEEQGHSEGLVLWHADHGNDSPANRESLLVAAGPLFQQGLVHAATEFVERALLLNPAPEDVLTQLLALCNRLIILSEFALARRYLVVCRRAAIRPKQVADGLRLEATIDSLDEEPIEIGAINVYARRYRKHSPRTSAELLAFAAVWLATAGDVVSARAQIGRAYQILPAERVTSDSFQNWARRFLDRIDGAGVGPTAADQDEPEFDDLPVHVRLIAARTLMIEERYDDARDTFRSLALEAPRRSQGAEWTARVLALSAENEIRAGNIADASRAIDALAEIAPTQSLRHLMLFAWNQAVVRDKPDAEALLSDACARATQMHQPLLSAQLSAFEGSVALMHGDLDEARYRLARAYDPALELRPDFIRMEGDFVEVLARHGEWDAARRVTARFAERAGNHPSRWSDTVLARCRAIIAPDEQLLAQFHDAITIAKQNGAQLEVGRARLSFAMALERLGQRPRATEQRQAAEYTFETLSAAGWAKAAGISVMAEPPLPNSLLSTLTESELAVLRLMHTGVRNKDIAAALFVSLRTVEVRITQIYRKLEARSRSHLLTLLPTELDQIDSF